MDIWTTPATSPHQGATDTALLLRYPDGTVVPVGVQSGHTAAEYVEPYGDMDGYTIVGVRQGGVTAYVDRVIKITVAQVKVGDQVVMNDSWTFRVASINDDDRIVRGLRDERGILWREPSRHDEIKIQIAGEDPREGS